MVRLFAIFISGCLLTSFAVGLRAQDISAQDNSAQDKAAQDFAAVDVGSDNQELDSNDLKSSPSSELAPESAPEVEKPEIALEQPQPPSAKQSLPVNAIPAKPPKLPKKSAISYPLLILFSSVVIALGITTAVARYLTRQPNSSFNPAQLQRFVLRLRAWWTICLFVVFGLVVHHIGIIILFGLISFWAFREFITMTPTRRGDHRALFWSLVVFTPLQYVLIALGETNWQWKSGQPIDFYGVYSIMIPVYASLFIPARIAMAGDHKRFLERSAQITSGLLICVYALSHVPALLDLDLADSSHNPWSGSSEGLIFFFILISQVADVLQWSWGQIAGKHVVAKEISPSRTWEGCIGGSLSAGLVGACLYKVTPFQMGESALISIIIAFVGFAGGMTMSAIKRNRNVQDYGTLVLGHAGVLDRIDTICFSAPVFYHITRFFFSI